MDVFSTELGIRLSFVKTSEFGGGLSRPTHPPRYDTVVSTSVDMLVYTVIRLLRQLKYHDLCKT
jgi:hypothetical protein